MIKMVYDEKSNRLVKTKDLLTKTDELFSLLLEHKWYFKIVFIVTILLNLFIIFQSLTFNFYFKFLHYNILIKFYHIIKMFTSVK